MVSWFSLKSIVNYPESTFHIINSCKHISWNCPLQCTIIIPFWWQCFKCSKFYHCLIFCWMSNIFKLESICYSSCIPSNWITHSNFFIFMNISYTVGIAFIINNSCCISAVLISRTKCFNLVILFRRISPFVS